MLRRVIVLFLLAGFGLAAVILGLWFSLYNAGPQTAVDLVIEQGASTTEVLDQVHEHGFLPSVFVAKLYLKFAADARSPKFGHYHLTAGASAIDVINLLLEGRVETFNITIVEGSTADEVCATMSGGGGGSLEEWSRLVQQTDWIADLAPNATSLEGFLFPDTYRFAVGISPAGAAKHLVTRFREVWREETTGRTEPAMPAPEIVTLASLVEAETSLPEERARVAGVFMNRLARGMLLQCDPTVVYALQKQGQWQGRLLRVHWQFDDPYNTYLYAGLPPGPINNPGRAALAAALSPEEHDFFYFVAKPGGGHSFSRTLKEHNRAVWRLRRSRR